MVVSGGVVEPECRWGWTEAGIGVVAALECWSRAMQGKLQATFSGEHLGICLGPAL